MASIGPVSMSTGSVPTRHWSAIRAAGSQAELAGPVGGHEQHRGRAVGDLGARARGVYAVLAADRLQFGQPFHGRLAQALVACHAVGGAGRFAFVVEVGRVDHQHLAVEAAFGPGLGGAALRLDAQRIGVMHG